MTGHITNRSRSQKVKQTYVSKSKSSITKSYVVERKPRYPYPVYGRFWIQDCRAPRFVPLLCRSSDDLKNSNQEMGVTTVIKDYGTEILDAIRQNNLQRLQLILEKQLKADYKIAKLCTTDIRHKPSKKFANPLILAARQEDPTILHYMMEKGADPNFVHHTIYSTKRREIVTALHIAVDLGYYENVEVLLSVNADCNIGDHNNETPLHIAVKKADRVMTRMLLSKGADPTIPDRFENAALHTATLYGHLQLVKTLLKYDADIFQKGQYGAVAPHIAAREGHIHLIQLFCSRYLGNINIKIPCFADGREKAPLHLSAEHGHYETVLALLDQYDADVNLKDSDGNTPLHCCVLNPYDPHRLREKEDFNDTAKILLKHRVSVNSKNAFGDSALHLAAMNHFQRIVEMLLEVGANPFIENNQKLKPIDVVPSDDPVTLQVLKMAMMQGPRPLRYPSLESNTEKDSSSGNLSSGQNTTSTRNNITTTETGTGSIENMLDRSLSIRSSTSTLPSVFGGEVQHKQKGNGRHPHVPLPAPPSNAREGLKPNEGKKDGKTRQTGKEQGQQTTEKEKPEYTQMGNLKPAEGKKYPKHDSRKGRHDSYDDSSNQDDTYSFMSQSTTCESGTQTRQKRGRDVGIMARRDRKKSVNKRLQTSFDLDASITCNEMSSQTDLQSYGDLQSMDRLQTSELSIQNLDKHSRQVGNYGYKSKSHKVGKDRHNRDKSEDDSEFYVNYKGGKTKDHSIPKSGSRHKLEKTQSNQQQRKKNDSQYEEDSEEDSDEYTEDDETAEMSQMTPYTRKKAATNKNDPPPGSVRVNTLPGKPGTIELQYSGGPLTIALDTQAFSNNVVQPDQQGQFFYDQHGNKYPAGMIYALQQASGLMSHTQGQVPLVSTQTGSDIQHIYKTPQRPNKQNADGTSTIGKPRAPSPKSEKERIYANQDEINAMLNGSLDNTESNDISLESPSAQVKSAIHESVHEVTKTPAKESRNVMSPTSSQGRSTPTRPSKQHDHLRKILGRATPTKRGTTPTKVDVGEQKVFDFDEPPLAQQEQEETTSSEEEEFEEAAEEPFSPPPPLPHSQPPPPPKAQPPQKQPRRSLQTPTMTETEKQAAESGQATLSTTAGDPVQVEVVTKAFSTRRKHPETPLIISRADQSFEVDRDDEDISPDQQWDETPNASPKYKSFSQKLAWAKGLEHGEGPHQLEGDESVSSPKKTKKSRKIPRNKTESSVEEETSQNIPEIQPRNSKSKKIRPPLSPGYKRAVGGVIREEDEEFEEEALPEYVKRSDDDDEETTSEEGEDSEEDSEEESDDEESGEEESGNDIVQSAAQPQGTHTEYYSITSIDKQSSSSSSSSKTSGSATTVVKPVNEVKTTITTETVTVVTNENMTEIHEDKLERLKAEAIMRQSDGKMGYEMEEYGAEPGYRIDRDLSPIGVRDRGFSPLGGRQTPDSVYSEGSYSGRGLNMRVTGDTPKAYHRGEKDQKRREWMKAKPVGIESGSEYSDNELGSRNSLNRSLSPGGQERSRKWSEENKPVYKKKTPFEGGNTQPIGHPIEHGKPPDGKSKGKLIGAYTKPYKSFGKIETKTDLLEEAMLTSPMSPMSPIHTSIPEELETFGEDESRQRQYRSTEMLETTTTEMVHAIRSPRSMSATDIRNQLRISPARFLETDPENAQPMDSDEATNLDSANTSVAKSPFKKNIKLSEPGPEMYETETIEQPVSIGASEEDLLKAAEIQNKKGTKGHKTTKSVTVKERKMTEDGEIIETVTTTVLATQAEQPQISMASVVYTDDEAFDDEEETSSESEEDEEIGQYEQEPGTRRPKQKQEVNKKSSKTTIEPNFIKTAVKQHNHSEDEEADEIGHYEQEPGKRRPKPKQEVKQYDNSDDDEAEEIGQYQQEPGTRRPKPKKEVNKQSTKIILEPKSDESVLQKYDVASSTRKYSPSEETQMQDSKVEIVETNFKTQEDTEEIETYGSEPGVRRIRKPESNTNEPKTNQAGLVVDDSSLNKQKSPFEEFTESPVKKPKTKKIKKTKKKNKEDSQPTGQPTGMDVPYIDDREDVELHDKDESIDLESYGAEPGDHKQKKKKKEKKIKKQDVVTAATTTTVTSDIYETNIDDEFNPDEEVKLYDEESEAYKDSVKLETTEQRDDMTIGYNPEPSPIQTTTIIKVPDEVKSPLVQGITSQQPAPKQAFETSFGPEDEEVAQINIAAAERKKKKKDKKKKIKKQEDVWAEQQKKAHEKKLMEQHSDLLGKPQEQKEIGEEVNEIPINGKTQQLIYNQEKQTDFNGQPLQYTSGQPQVASLSSQNQQAIPAAEITFSGGIQVINETQMKKARKNKTEQDEGNEKVKKKKKKKTDKTTKKKIKGMVESVESLNEETVKYYQDNNNILGNEKDIDELQTQNQPPVVIKTSISVQEENIKNKLLNVEETAIDESSQSETHKPMENQESDEKYEGELNQSGMSVDEQSGIHGTVMGSKVERCDTIKKMDIINMDRMPVKKRREDSEEISEESESEYSDDEDVITDDQLPSATNPPKGTITETNAQNTTVREQRIWQQYHKQQQESLEKAKKGRGPKYDVKETDIDADIYETNIDDDIADKYPPEEAEDTNIDDEEEPLPPGDFKRVFGARRSIGCKKQKRKGQYAQNGKQAQEEPQFEIENGLPTEARQVPGSMERTNVTSTTENITRTKEKSRHTRPKGSSMPLQQGGLKQASQPENVYNEPEDGDEEPLSWRDQKEQEEKMKQMLKSYQDYDAASLDSDQYATIEYGHDPHIQQHRGKAPPLSSRDDPRYHSLPSQPTYDQQMQPYNNKQTNRRPRNHQAKYNEEMMAQMWAQQQGHPVDHRRPRHSDQDPHGQYGDPRRPRRSDSKGHTSDTDTTTDRKRKKKLKFLEDVHSEAELQDLDPFPANTGKSLQEAAMETLTASLQHQTKLTVRKPLESAHPEKPINYTRGVYRPQPVYWRGSRGPQSNSSSRYNDSQLMTQMWSEQHQQGGGTESEGDIEAEYLEPINMRRNRPADTSSLGDYPRDYPQDYPSGMDPNYMDDRENMAYPSGGAFQPYGPKRVKVHDEQRRRKEEREQREAALRERQRRKKERAPKTNIGPVDFTKYPATAKIWMEQVDKETVQKSKTMYLSVMPEGMKPPPEIENNVPSMEGVSPDDVFLPPQWVIARGRSSRLMKRSLGSQQRESMGSLSGVTSGESDFEGMDRPNSPGRQMLLFFRVGNNWTDLVWILFEGILNDSETKRMIADIQLKYPRSLTGQVNNFMHRWWKRKGPGATIEELRRALDIGGMPYIQEEFFDKRRTITSNTDTEDDLEMSEVSDNDPEVSRLIQEYEIRSLNTSYAEPGQLGSLGQKKSMSGDNLMRRLENMNEKGTTIDRSRISSHLSASDSVFKRNSEMEFEDSMEGYGSDVDARRAFVIVQPQLKHKDYNYETQI